MQRLPMSGNSVAISAPEGSSIAEFVAMGFPAAHRAYVVAELDGIEIDARDWAKTRPTAGQALTLVFRPAGKNFLRTILTIAVVAVGLWVSGGGLAGLLGQGFAAGSVGAAIAAAGVSIVGNLLINALVPIGAPSRGTQEAPPPFYSITGARNASPAWGKVPILFGRHRIVPPLAGQVIRETDGDETYLRIPLLLGVTPMAVSDWKAGETLLSSLPGVEIETRLLETDPPHTMYPGDPAQQLVDALLSTSQTVRTTAANVDEIKVGLAFKSGLGAYNGKQQKIAANVTLDVSYRLTGSVGGWTSLRPNVPQANEAAYLTNGNRYRPALLVTDPFSAYAAALATVPAVSSGDLSYTRSDPGRGFAREIRFAVPRGQYDVRVMRINAQSTDPNTTDAVWWDTLSSIASQVDPFPNRKLATAVIRIKSGAEASGVIEQINCIGQALVPGFTSGALASPSTATAASLTAPSASRNPALEALMCLRGHHNAVPVPDDEIDWPAWADFAARCEAADYTFDEYVQQNISRWEMANRICGAGLARLDKFHGRRTVIVDRARDGEPPAQVFNTRNVLNFRWRKTFPKEVHGVRVGFANELNGWNADEVIVYMPGYDASNATIFETLPVPGGTHPDQLRTVVNQYLRNAFYQTEAFEFEQDIESLTVSRGAYVLVRHDVILVGKGDAKVQELHMSGGNVVGFTLDFGIETDAGPTLGARWRKVRNAGGIGRIEVDGEVAVTRVLDNPRRFNFGAPRATSAAPAVGDLVSIGETGQVAFEALVQDIRPMPGFKAGITLVSYAGERFAAGGAWPPHNPMTTVPFGSRPATPQLIGASAGSREIAVGFKMPKSPTGITVTGFEVAVRETGSSGDTWAPCGVLQAEERLATAPPGDPGTTYDMRIIAKGYDGGGISVSSMPLIVPAIAAESAAFAPQSVNASFVVRTSTAGSQQPVLVSTWTPNEDPDVIDTYVEMLASTGPDVWRALGSAPAISGAFEMHGLQVDRSYTLRFYNVTRRGAISTRVVKAGVVAPDSMVAAFAGVASSIIGQGWGATASEAAARATRGQGLAKNSRFEEAFTSGVPPKWTAWNTGAGSYASKLTGDGNAYRLTLASSVQGGVYQTLTSVAPGDYLMVGEATREVGTYAAAGIHVQFYDASSNPLTAAFIYFATDADTGGAVATGGEHVRRWEKLVTAPAGAASAVLYAMGHWSSLGSIAAANQIVFYECDLIPMSLVRQLRADITSGNTAAAIAGQGWGATASEAAARASRGYGVCRNSQFQEPFSGTALPPQWNNWQNGAGVFDTKPTGDGYSFRLAAGAGASAGVTQNCYGVAPSTEYMIVGSVRRDSGTLAGAGVLVEFYTAGAVYNGAQQINFATDPTTAGQITPVPDGVARWEKVITTPANTAFVAVYAMNHWTGHGSVAAANQIYWYEADLIPMTLVRQLRADVTSGNTAGGIAGQGALATANTVGTGQINPNSVTGTATSTGATGGTSVAITTQGGPVVLLCSFISIVGCDGGGSDYAEHTPNVFRSGGPTLYPTGVPANRVQGGGDKTGAWAATVMDYPPAGTHTYYLGASYNSYNGNRNDVLNAVLVALELKR